MRKVYGGQKVKRGWYFDLIEKRFIYIQTNGEELPGESNRLYISLNVIELIGFILLMGGAYVLFLPSLGLVVVSYVVLIHIAVFII